MMRVVPPTPAAAPFPYHEGSGYPGSERQAPVAPESRGDGARGMTWAIGRGGRHQVTPGRSKCLHLAKWR